MNEDNILNVGLTVELFDLQVDEKMLPSGTNPRGVGRDLLYSSKKLDIVDMKKVAIGPRVQPKVHEDGSVVGLQKLRKEGDFEWAPYVEDDYQDSAENAVAGPSNVATTDQGNLIESIEMLRNRFFQHWLSCKCYAYEKPGF